MAQTPYRDIISSAEVDFRFYKESLRDHSSNGVELTALASPAVANYTIAHGTRALASFETEADQTWMASGVTDVTIEFLISADMLKAADDITCTILDGDWNIGFLSYNNSGSNYQYHLRMSFCGVTLGRVDENIYQIINSSTIDELRGSPLHVIISAKYTASTSLEVTTYINGHYANDTISYAAGVVEMTAAPTNTIPLSGAPTYFLRMWEEFIEDELILHDMYQNAKKVLPNSHWVKGEGTLAKYVPA